MAFDTKDAATAHLEKVGVDQRTGAYVSPAASAVRFEEVAERWFEEQVHQRSTTLAVIRRRLDLTILPSLGGVRLSRLDRATVQSAVTSWSSELAASTVRVAYVYLAGICTLAVRERRMAATPCQGINLPRVALLPVVPMTTGQVQALMLAAPAFWRPMFVLAAATGMRSGELRGLTWDRVREVDGGAVLSIDRQLTRDAMAGRPAWGPLKTKWSVRSILIGKSTLDALGERGEGTVLKSPTGGCVTHKVAWQRWNKAAAVSGVGDEDGTGWHELRHFHASLLIAGGHSPVAVAHRLGHKDATETLRTYAHLWVDDDERMRDATDGVIVLPES
ncbi:tyrosine-type recombinase/integrase [Cellulomonas soli]|uniref:tyrosine-type recombinase/integrase n=1 Tax=Cellulomonas soli TaxID=931535 RepID=UPI003F82E077